MLDRALRSLCVCEYGADKSLVELDVGMMFYML
jgi:hypothetical protein